MLTRRKIFKNPIAGNMGVQSAVLVATSATRTGRGGSCFGGFTFTGNFVARFRFVICIRNSLVILMFRF